MMKLAALLAALSAVFWSGPSAVSGPIQKAHASHDGLALVLSLRVYSSTVKAQAKLTNTGSSPFEYYGGCAPPIVQIQARDTAGRHVYGWVPPRVNCLALSVQHLAPGASVRTRVHFTIVGPVKVRGVVQVKVGARLFQTRPITVIPR